MYISRRRVSRRWILAAALPLAACAAQRPRPTPTPPAPPTPTPVPTTVAATRAVRSTEVTSVDGPLGSEAKALAGAGATFPAPLYSRWFGMYGKLTGVQVVYQSIGSGAGIKSISEMTVDFGASDAPLTDEQLKGTRGGDLLHIPTALGAVVPTYNVPGIAEPLRFRGETLAGIFLGTIQRWNDPMLVADNPALAKLERDVVVVHRSDGSGTSFIWSDYLSQVSTAWRMRVGAGTTVRWPVGLGGEGNPGVARLVKQNDYAIGYVELGYAVQNGLGVGHVLNRAGRFMEPTLGSVTNAAAAAEGIGADLRASIVNAPGEASYPIAGFTYQLVYRVNPDRQKALALARLLWWELHQGQRYTTELQYAPLPGEVVARAEEKVLSIREG